MKIKPSVRIIGTALCGLILTILWPGRPGLSPPLASAAQGILLGDRHKELGIACEGCHQENPPQKPPPMAACLQCHGDYAQLAEKTRKTNPNPHDSHEGEIECSKCHHSHKPSESYCSKCHNYAFKVP